MSVCFLHKVTSQSPYNRQKGYPHLEGSPIDVYRCRSRLWRFTFAFPFTLGKRRRTVIPPVTYSVALYSRPVLEVTRKRLGMKDVVSIFGLKMGCTLSLLKEQPLGYSSQEKIRSGPQYEDHTQQQSTHNNVGNLLNPTCLLHGQFAGATSAICFMW